MCRLPCSPHLLTRFPAGPSPPLSGGGLPCLKELCVKPPHLLDRIPSPLASSWAFKTSHVMPQAMHYSHPTPHSQKRCFRTQISTHTPPPPPCGQGRWPKSSYPAFFDGFVKQLHHIRSLHSARFKSLCPGDQNALQRRADGVGRRRLGGPQNPQALGETAQRAVTKPRPRGPSGWLQTHWVTGPDCPISCSPSTRWIPLVAAATGVLHSVQI